MIDTCFGMSAFLAERHFDLDLPSDSTLVRAYGEPAGEHSLRTWIAETLGERHRTDIDPRRVCISDGATGALLLALGVLAEPDSEVIVPSVCFPVFRMLPRFLGVRAVDAPLTDRHNYDVAMLRRAITRKTRAIVVNSPLNPLGGTLSHSELAEIASWGVPIVSDEVYTELAYDAPLASMLDVAPSSTFVVNSVSKTYALPGLRIGYLVSPAEFAGPVRELKAVVNICTNRPAQQFARTVFEARNALIQTHCAYLRERRDLFLGHADRFGIPLVARPKAGLYGALDVSEFPGSSLEVALQLVERQGVAVAAGVDFAAADPKFLRINFAVERQSLTAALTRIGAFYAELREGGRRPMVG
jgi:aspartate/methionine/tyrosine aminotransferase